MLTGRYSWRTKLQKGVVKGFEPCLIDENRPTIASFLASQDYDTAIIGKWHLNNLFLDGKSGKSLNGKVHKWAAPVGALLPDGPVHRGFGYFHGIHHARSMKAIIENDKVVAHDDPLNFLPRCAEKCVAYIDSRHGTGKPFFLYVPLGAPHTPILPTEQWQGKSGLGKYGDFVMQTDDAIGKVIDSLARNGFLENTLVVVSSDNGCSRAADIVGLARKGHHVSGPFRGSKADIWDGGHRVPFFVRWPGRVAPGSISDQLICLTDVFATIVDVLKKEKPTGSCEDSVSFLPALLGKPIQSDRVGIVHHSFSGHFADRNGSWKLILARASGGWSSPTEKEASSNAAPAQLYDMQADISERTNLFDLKPKIARQLLEQLEKDVFSGRSTDGPSSLNDLPNESIKLWKSGKMMDSQ